MLNGFCRALRRWRRTAFAVSGLALLAFQAVAPASATARSLRAVPPGHPSAARGAPAASGPSGQAGHAIVPGFSSAVFPGNDDGSTDEVPLPFPVDFYDTLYSGLYVNNNGNVTFGGPVGTYTPESLNQIDTPMIAPFWADVDTRVGNVVTYGYGKVNGHLAFGVNWLDVGCYNENDGVTDTFQLILIDRSDVSLGDFDIEFNYGPMTWDSGQASSGDAQCLNGTAARAGFTSGIGPSYELPGSGVNDALLSSDPVTGLSSHRFNSSQVGQYIYHFRNGQPDIAHYAPLGDSYASGVGTGSYYDTSGNCFRSYGGWSYLMSANYPAAPKVQPPTFFACSGANMGSIALQIAQLKDWTAANGPPDLVTVMIGGNDAGWGNAIAACFFHNDCLAHLRAVGAYIDSSGFIAQLQGVYSKIAAAASDPTGASQVVAVGYPRLFPSDTSASFYFHCPWIFTGSGQDALDQIQADQSLLDATMVLSAIQTNIDYVTLGDLFAGHELCTGEPYINGLSFKVDAAHPNATGQALIAQEVASQLGFLTGTGSTGQAAGRKHVGVKASRPAQRPALAARPGGPARAAGVAPRATAALTQTPALAGGEVSVPYNGYLIANGGTGPYTWAVTSGSLPAGLSLDSSSGLVSGTPTGTGTTDFSVTVTDSANPANMVTSATSITVDPVPALAVSAGPAGLPVPTAGQPYQGSLPATGGLPPYNWAVTSGSLPAGLSLDSSTGAVTGTPAKAGKTTFTVTATDSASSTASATRTLTVLASGSTLTPSSAPLAGGTAGHFYSGRLTATGGKGSLDWSVSSGSLPTGLSLDPGTGDITGIPTGPGSYSFTAHVIDSVTPIPHSASRKLSITIAAGSAPSIGATSVPDGTAGVPYLGAVTASGGVLPYTWSVSSGALPDGLSLDPGSGEISGTPTTAGTFAFTVSAADSRTPSAQVASHGESITIAPAVQPPGMSASDTVTNATIGAAYNASVIPDGGTGPYSYSVSSGVLPDGLSLDSQAGTITGTPMTAGTFTATIEVTDSSAPTPQTATDDISITVGSPGPLAIGTSSLPDGNVAAAYSSPVEVSGGTGADSFAVTGGSLPDGLSLDPNAGIITGTPTGTGTSDFTVTVTDSAAPTPDSTSVALSLTIDQATALTMPAPSLPVPVQGGGYFQTLNASGGVPPYSWSVTSGSLPDGLSLDPATGIISGTPTGTGTSAFTVTVTDSSQPSAQSASQDVSLTVSPSSPLSVATSALDPARQGSAYDQTLVASGGTSPVSWSVASGSLPAGLSLDSGTGEISGTPTGAGTSYFTVQATDSSTPTPQVSAAKLSLEVIPLPKAATRTALTVRPTSVLLGQETKLVFTVRVSSQSAGVSSGSVTIKAGKRKLCTIRRLSRGSGKCRPSSGRALPRGTYRVTAIYSGSSLFLGSLAKAVTVKIR